MESPLYTTAQAAKMLGVTPALIRHYCLNHAIMEPRPGRLNCILMGRDWMITADGMKALRARNTKRGPIPQKRKKVKKA